MNYKTISGISAFQNFSMLFGPPDTVLLLEVVLKNVVELYLQKLTSLVLDVYLYFAYCQAQPNQNPSLASAWFG